jgi:antitoxin component HigA of HigAB toxin-antitoxin module
LVKDEVKPIAPIRDDSSHCAALAEIEDLWGSALGTPDGDRLDVLMAIVDDYERNKWPDENLDPVDAIKARMENSGRTRKDLENIVGSSSRASEILNRRRHLTLPMIWRLVDEWKIPAEVLVRPYELAPQTTSGEQGAGRTRVDVIGWPKEDPSLRRLMDEMEERRKIMQAVAVPPEYTTRLRSESAVIQRLTDEMEQQRKLMQAVAVPPEHLTRLGPESAAIQRLTDEMKHQQELMRAALGPFEDLKRLNVMHSPFADAISQASLDFAAFTDRFRLPALREIEPLLHNFKTLEATLSPFHVPRDSFQDAIASMRTPWLDAQNSLRSVAGFAGIQELGLQLHRHAAFDPSVTNTLRSALGDWRSPIKLPTNIFDDIAGRTALYSDRGLNPDLTAFPAEAFKQSLSIAGLNDAPPPLAAPYLTDADTEDWDEEAGFQRTNAAHDRLLRFETQLRQFIDGRMKIAFGEHWIKHQVPGGIRQSWEHKKQIARDNGESEQPLIAFADFTDYVTIITRRDNWSAVFASVFGRADSVTESFQRLYPIRLCTMHARIITQDDELYLHVETMRLLKAIGVLK